MKVRKFEKTLAALSFATAVILSFVGVAIGKENGIAGNTCMVIAQFLTLTATLLGFDYKFNNKVGS